MIRLGVVDFDTSHVTEFTARLNHKGVPRSQWVEGATVVLGCPGESQMAPERIPAFKAEMQMMGVPLVEKPTDMIGKVDGILVCSLEGGVHLERAAPFLEAGIPCFIDKPFACSVADSQKIVALAARHRAAIFSSSSLRFAPEVVSYLADEQRGNLLGVVTHGPAHLPEPKGGATRNPGLFHYGIHPAELLYTLMGPGCVRVSCAHEKDADVVTGQWKDGRLATVRGLRRGAMEYGFLAFSEKEVKHQKVGTAEVYRELLKQIVKFFQTKKSPVPIEETLELMAFLAAAVKSSENRGSVELIG